MSCSSPRAQAEPVAQVATQSLLDLPNELFSLIIRSLDKRSLLQLILSSQRAAQKVPHEALLAVLQEGCLHPLEYELQDQAALLFERLVEPIIAGLYLQLSEVARVGEEEAREGTGEKNSPAPCDEDAFKQQDRSPAQVLSEKPVLESFCEAVRLAREHFDRLSTPLLEILRTILEWSIVFGRRDVFMAAGPLIDVRWHARQAELFPNDERLIALAQYASPDVFRMVFETETVLREIAWDIIGDLLMSAGMHHNWELVRLLMEQPLPPNFSFTIFLDQICDFAEKASEASLANMMHEYLAQATQWEAPSLEHFSSVEDPPAE